MLDKSVGYVRDKSQDRDDDYVCPPLGLWPVVRIRTVIFAVPVDNSVFKGCFLWLFWSHCENVDTDWMSSEYLVGYEALSMQLICEIHRIYDNRKLAVFIQMHDIVCSRSEGRRVGGGTEESRG